MQKEKLIILSFHFAACTNDLDLVFLLDQSGSIGYNNHLTALQFLHNVSSFYNVSANRTQVMLLNYLLKRMEQKNCRSWQASKQSKRDTISLNIRDMLLSSKQSK